MEPTTKKHKVQGTVAYPHIGNYLARHFANNGINRNELARQIGVANSTTTGYMKQQSLQFGILWKMSVALKQNLLAEMALRLPVDFPTPRVQALELQLQALKQEVNELKIQNEAFKSVLLNK